MIVYCAVIIPNEVKKLRRKKVKDKWIIGSGVCLVWRKMFSWKISWFLTYFLMFGWWLEIFFKKMSWFGKHLIEPNMRKLENIFGTCFPSYQTHPNSLLLNMNHNYPHKRASFYGQKWIFSNSRDTNRPNVTTNILYFFLTKSQMLPKLM